MKDTFIALCILAAMVGAIIYVNQLEPSSAPAQTVGGAQISGDGFMGMVWCYPLAETGKHPFLAAWRSIGRGGKSLVCGLVQP